MTEINALADASAVERRKLNEVFEESHFEYLSRCRKTRGQVRDLSDRGGGQEQVLVVDILSLDYFSSFAGGFLRSTAIGSPKLRGLSKGIHNSLSSGFYVFPVLHVSNDDFIVRY